ncbi:MAG: Lin0512 family protein [Hyphomicrobiaceae bacterium]
MTVKRMVLEIGMGTDIRGADSTKAASRALRDALWRNSINIADVCGKTRDEMIIDVHLGVPRPETVDHQVVLSVLPYGAATLHVVDGGLEVPTDDGDDSTIVAHAVAVVSLDIE